jgi:hypothetical protein
MVAERYCLLPRPVVPAAPSLEPLTAAEQGVLAYVCAGYSNKEIAAFLDKAEPTGEAPGQLLPAEVRPVLPHAAHGGVAVGAASAR